MKKSDELKMGWINSSYYEPFYTKRNVKRFFELIYLIYIEGDFDFYIVSYKKDVLWHHYATLFDYENTVKIFGITIRKWKSGYHYDD